MSNQFLATLSILNGVRAKLEALQLAAPLPEDAAFAEVKVYSQENLVAGLQEMYLFDDRNALVIPTGFTHNTQQLGGKLVVQRFLEFVVMVTDRNFGGEATAFTGEAGVNPGSLVLGEMTAAALNGETLGIKGVCIYATDGEPFRLTDAQQQDAPARECWAQTFKATAGEVRTAIPAGLQVL